MRKPSWCPLASSVHDGFQIQGGAVVAGGANAVEQGGVDQAAGIDHQVGGVEQAAALEGDQFRVARAGAEKDHRVTGYIRRRIASRSMSDTRPFFCG